VGGPGNSFILIFDKKKIGLCQLKKEEEGKGGRRGNKGMKIDLFRMRIEPIE